MTGPTEYDRIQQVLESLVENVEYIEEVIDLDDQFYLEIDGGEEKAEYVVQTLKESGLIDDGFDVETITDPETGEIDVRVVSAALKQTEEEVAERVNHYLEKYEPE